MNKINYTPLEKTLLKRNKILEDQNKYLRGSYLHQIKLLDTRQKIVLNLLEQIRKLKCEISTLRLYQPSTKHSSTNKGNKNE